MLFVDQSLAHRVERSLSLQARGFAEACRLHAPQLGVEMLTLGPCAQAVYYGPGSVLSRTGGLGIGSPAAPEQLAAAEAFFFSRAEECKIELCPLADPSLLPLLKDRGYRVNGFVSVFLRGVPPAAEPLDPAPGIEARVAADAEFERVLDVVHAGFGGSPTDPIRRHMGVSRRRPSVRLLGAYNAGDNAPIGGGSLELVDDVALLFGASTLPQHRAKGVQTTLLRERLHLARESGACDLIVIQSKPGIPSERNILRHGFQLAYTRVQVSKAR